MNDCRLERHRESRVVSIAASLVSSYRSAARLSSCDAGPSCLVPVTGISTPANSIRSCDSQRRWHIAIVVLLIEIECEDDSRWLAEVRALSGVMCYGADRDEAIARVQALALRVIAERLEHREAPAQFLNVTFQAA